MVTQSAHEVRQLPCHSSGYPPTPALYVSGRSGAMAKQCAWCHRPETIRDQTLIYLGATTTHGMCPACAAEWMMNPAVPQLQSTGASTLS